MYPNYVNYVHPKSETRLGTFTFLGTGTSQGVPVIGCHCEVCLSGDTRDHRLRTSGLVSIGGKNIVIDAGPDFRQQLLRAKVDDVECILLTHEHNDHVIGLDDVRPFNFNGGKGIRRMPLYATQRVQEEVRSRFSYAFARNPYPGAPQFDLRTIEKSTGFEVGGMEIIPIEVMHGDMPVLGFRFGDFTYITDCKTIADTELAKARGTKTLVINALHHREHHSHLNLRQALALIAEVKPEHAYIIHVSHSMGLYTEVSKTLPNGVSLGCDGGKVDINA